jgi:hypothetical protein
MEQQSKNIKTGAKVSLIILQLYILAQFISIYQTSYQLVSSLIPAGTA